MASAVPPQAGDTVEVIRQGDQRFGARGTVVTAEAQGVFVKFSNTSETKRAVAVEGFKYDSIKVVAPNSRSPSSPTVEPATTLASEKHQKPTGVSPVAIDPGGANGTSPNQEQRVEVEKDLFDRSREPPAPAGVVGHALDYASETVSERAALEKLAAERAAAENLTPETVSAALKKAAVEKAATAKTVAEKAIAEDKAAEEIAAVHKATAGKAAAEKEAAERVASFWQQQETDEVSTALQEAFNNLVMENPSDPLRFLGAEFTRLSRDPNQLATSSLKDKGAEAVLAALLDGEPKVRVASDEPLPAKTEGLPYWGGAFGDDGKLYLIARESRRVMTFDPRTERWGSFGEELPARPNKWLGAARCSDGCIYALPGGARQALKIDPAAGTAALFGDDVTALANVTPGECNWHETVLADDGFLYGVPHNANCVLKFDPTSGKASVFGDLKGKAKYIGGIYCPTDGCIYAPPFLASRCLRIDPVNETAEYFGDPIESNQYHDGAFGVDGRIYCIPGGKPNSVLCIDPETQSVSFVEPEQLGKWNIMRSFKGDDGCVYGVAHGQNQLLRVDPISGDVSAVGERFGPEFKRTLYGAIAAPNGTVFGLPMRGGAPAVCIHMPPKLPLLRQLLDEHPETLRAAINSDPAPFLLLLAAQANEGGAEGARLSCRLLEAAAKELLPCLQSDVECSRQGTHLRARALLKACEMLGEAQATAVGEAVPGEPMHVAYQYGTFGQDGKLYLIPRLARRVACYDPSSGRFRQIGDELEAGLEYCGGALCDDGCIYSLPIKGSRALKIDPAQGTAVSYGDDLSNLIKPHSNENIVLGPDGCIYGMPCNGNDVLRFDPKTGRGSTFGDIAAAAEALEKAQTGTEEGKQLMRRAAANQGGRYISGIYNPADKCIYAIPFNARRVLRIIPATSRVELVGDDLGGGQDKWCGGGVGADGAIYMIPMEATRVLRLDPITGTTSLIGPVLPGNRHWGNGFAADDGNIYGVPRNDPKAQLLRIDTTFQTVARVGKRMPRAVQGKLSSAARAADGSWFGLPLHLPCPTMARFDLPPPPPFAFLDVVMRDDAALIRCLTSDATRSSFVTVLTSVLTTRQPSGSAAATQQAAVVALLQKRLPTFHDACLQLVKCPVAASHLSTDDRSLVLEGIVRTSLYLEGHCEWSPAPNDLSEWVYPSKQPAGSPLLEATKAIERSGPEAVEATWKVVAPLGEKVLTRIIEAIRASEQAQKVLLEAYNKEREGSLLNYNAALLRCKREPTFHEYSRTSERLQEKLAPRREACKQSESDFPTLLKHGGAVEEQFVEFVTLLAERTRAIVSLPAAKLTRYGANRCLKGGWRALEKMVLRPGALEPGANPLDSANLLDIVRGSLRCADFNVLVTVLDMLLNMDDEFGNDAKLSGIDMSKFRIHVHRVKCRFTQPTSGGWADMLINLSFVNDPTKHIVELQLQHEMLLVVRKEGGAHEKYASFRSAFELLEAVGKAPKDEFVEKKNEDDLSPVEQLAKRLATLEAQLEATQTELKAERTERAALEQRVGGMKLR